MELVVVLRVVILGEPAGEIEVAHRPPVHLELVEVIAVEDELLVPAVHVDLHMPVAALAALLHDVVDGEPATIILADEFRPWRDGRPVGGGGELLEVRLGFGHVATPLYQPMLAMRSLRSARNVSRTE